MHARGEAALGRGPGLSGAGVSMETTYREVADMLGVRLEGPTVIELASGDHIDVDLIFGGFGTDKGTLVAESPRLWDLKDEICASGYSWSMFGPVTPESSITREDMIDLLSDWGWGGSADERPHWLRDRVEDTE